MAGSRGRAAALIAVATAVTFAPAAHAAQGSDSATRGDYVVYTADAGEANHFVADTWGSGLHMSDSGAVIRWVGEECAAAVHDVYCDDQAGGFYMDVNLGDGADTFRNRSKWIAEVHLGAGDDRAFGGDVGVLIDGGPGADDLHGGPPEREANAFFGQAVTYASSKRAVTVTPDNRANDGARGEHDNVHADVHELDGSRYGDTVTGFKVERGAAGNDHLTGTRGRDNIDGGRGNDVLVGRGGPDTLSDYYGTNIFRTRDGAVDHIYCGKGHDTVYADREDVIEPSPFGGTCEDVRRR